MIKTAFVAVGDELLKGKMDTNSTYLYAKLKNYGIPISLKIIVGDNKKNLVDVIRYLEGRVGLVVVSGGLGPTLDDITRFAAAEAVGVKLCENKEVLANLERRFAEYGKIMPDSNKVQALIPETATLFDNPIGTAPGFLLTFKETKFFFFPGVPSEFKIMVDRYFLPIIADYSQERVHELQVVFAAVAESFLADKLADFANHLEENEKIGIYPSPGIVKVILEARSQKRLAKLKETLEKVFENLPVSYNGASLEEVIGDLLRNRSETLAGAESCTGGMVGEMITSVPGSSDYFLGSAVTYSNEAKVRLLGVTRDALTKFGAVSKEVVVEMAIGAKKIYASDHAFAISGIAGPGGSTPEKPVGLVHFALATDSQVIHKSARFPGERDSVRKQAAIFAMELLRRYLLRVDYPLIVSDGG